MESRPLVIATHNRKKAGEMVTILSERLPGVELLSLADLPSAPEPEETGGNYHENAAIKAASAALVTGFPSLADDAGLEIDALGGAPGLYSKRFGGEDLPFPAKMAGVLELLKDTPDEQRTARFRCVIAFVRPNEDGAFEPRFFEATCEGRIARESSGSGGFGYDPIFYLPELACTMADLTAEQKHQISHRGKVLRTFADWFGPM